MDEKQLIRFIDRILAMNDEEPLPRPEPAPEEEESLSESDLLALIGRSLAGKNIEQLDELLEILRSQHMPERYQDMVVHARDGWPETGKISPECLSASSLEQVYNEKLYWDDRC